MVVSSIVTIFKDSFLQSKKNSKDSEFLAVQVSLLLDQYVIGCSDVVGDDGLCHGRTNEHGCRESQVAAPNFALELLAVECKSLPAVLMNDVLSFPSKAKQVAEFVAGAGEFSDPPDHWEWFEERQYQYARLGIEAASLATRLRLHAKVSSQPFVDCDHVAYMSRRKEEIEQVRKERDERNRLSPLS
ncbi:conserved protein of unknown function [Ralstonia solanacearum CMR15]|nr:conserved protein of unknown function [Ralstonia solanacearum CMR15]